MAPRANREWLLRLHGFSTITLIALAIIVLHVVCLVDETESARETKGVKSSKSNKDKVRVNLIRLYSTSIQQSANLPGSGIAWRSHKHSFRSNEHSEVRA